MKGDVRGAFSLIDAMIAKRQMQSALTALDDKAVNT